MRFLTTVGLALLAGPLLAQGPAKEPKYTGQPGYLKLVFHHQKTHTVWVVLDGNTLYVDRNGNGDLTEADERIEPQKANEAEARNFEVASLKLGERVHKLFTLSEFALSRYKDNPELMAQPQIKEVLNLNPNARGVMVSLSVQSERLTSSAKDGRIMQMAGFYDPKGVLQFAAKPEAASVVHFDGPLELGFYGSKPSTWKRGASLEPALMVGTPGQGGGTFAMLSYTDTIPESATVQLEVTQKGEPPILEKFELKERC